ncbi:hypothetical protein [Streptomyces similanensis]|uniref:hypothetical protein n=1 Tax=Streptomyces similanensis TaxID=1274988 RepID=UPI0031EB2E65
MAAVSLLSAALVLGVSSASAENRASEQSGAGWSASYATVNASGTTRPLKDESIINPKTAVEGELRNTGSECYSVWIQWTVDMTVTPPFKIGTQCGTGTAPVYFEKTGGLGTTWVRVCRGNSTPLKECGPLTYL